MSRKKSKFLIIFVALIFIGLGLYSMVNETNLNNTFNHKKKITFIQEEIDSIKSINIKVLPDTSQNFDTNIVIYDFADGRISFEVNVLNPRVQMNQVIISAFLGEQVLNLLNTPHSLITNVIAVKNADKSFKKNFNLIPNGEIKGITASSNMVYFDNATLDEVLETVPFIVIKCSWHDKENNLKIDYLKFSKENYILKKNRN
jgi:hypothetical protein